MDAIQETFSRKERDSEAMKTFGLRLKGQFTINEAYRRPKELEWLESLRQYKGLYDPEVKIEKNASKVYPKITRSKVTIVLSRLHEMLFPDTEKNWEIEPTPDPKISPEIVKQIAMSLVKEEKDETGTVQMRIPTIQELRLGIKKFAKDTCESMSTVIDDQLTEMDYKEETKKVLRSGLMYGTGVMKGPMIDSRVKRIWEPKADGNYVETEQSEDIPYYKATRIWDWYPDMSVTELENGEGSFERHIMTKHDLRQLMKRNDFYPEMIREYLENHPSGDYVAKNWEVDLQAIEIEAGTGKSGGTSAASSSVSSNPDDANRSTNRQLGKKYQVLEFWGYVDGSDLEACGVHVDDVSLEYGANVWLLGNIPIKAELFDGALDQYTVFYYEKDETSLMGEGLPRIMRHSQIAISAGARMVLDNGACVAGPQVEVNIDLVPPGVDINSFYPRKIWPREGRGIEAQYPAVRALNFDSHIDELLSIIEAFKQFGDEETTLPTWMIGQMVNNETAQATSGRMATITVSIKDVVKNFDAFTERIIRGLYAWNMEFNPRPDIKGDYKVKARGVSSLVMKEIRMQALNQLAQTMTEDDWVYVERRDFLKERFKAHDINITLRTEEEADKVREAKQNSLMNQLMIQQLQADIAYKKSQTMAQLTKAKDKNVEANVRSVTPPEAPAPGADPRLNDAEVIKKQTEIDKLKEDMRMQQEKHELELAKIRQEMEEDKLKNRMEMIHDDDKAKSDLDLKKKTAEHSMKVKEKTATIKAKQKPAVSKPQTPKKPSGGGK
jgi:hypothetical protein